MFFFLSKFSMSSLWRFLNECTIETVEKILLFFFVWLMFWLLILNKCQMKKIVNQITVWVFIRRWSSLLLFENFIMMMMWMRIVRMVVMQKDAKSNKQLPGLDRTRYSCWHQKMSAFCVCVWEKRKRVDSYQTNRNERK